MMNSSDAWHQKALGKSAETVWNTLLRHGGMTAKGISVQTGRSVITVRRSLDRLWMVGLAYPDGGGVWIAEPAGKDTLQEISVEFGTMGIAVKRKARHELERSAWASQQMLRQKEQWEQKHGRENPENKGLCEVCRHQE